jgi:putative transcriptional regulator
MQLARSGVAIAFLLALLGVLEWSGASIRPSDLEPTTPKVAARDRLIRKVALPNSSPNPSPTPQSEPLAAGKLLVATPQLNGPFFAQSVILLLDYDESGALGLIINQQTSVPVAELLTQIEGIEARDDHLFVGGPVSPSSVAFLIRAEEGPPESRRLIDGVHVSGSPRVLEHVLETELPADRFHVYVGYAGWGPRQLDDELARGDWWVASAEADIIFDAKPDALWRKLFMRFGGVQVRRGDLPACRDQVPGTGCRRHRDSTLARIAASSS